MRGIYNFVITPIDGKYNNIKDKNKKDLILNKQMYNHQFINRED